MRIGPKTWMIAQAKTVTPDKDGVVDLHLPIGWLKMVGMDAHDVIDVIPIFTSEEKANEYIRATNEENKATVVAIRNLGVLVDLLERFVDAGYAEGLTIDPEKKTGKGQQAPLREFVADLRANMRQP